MRIYDKINQTSWELEAACNIIIGDNGTGKTTLLDILAGIVVDDNIKIVGNDNLVYMNQSSFFFDRLKVKDNVLFFLKLKGISNGYAYLENFNRENGQPVDLVRLWNSQIGYLSGGEKRLVYFFTILSLDFGWYLLDEPFAGTDKKNKTKMVNIIKRKIEAGKRFVIVSHDDNIANMFCVCKVHDLSSIPLQWKYKN
ncbi:MAG: ATP-binding cassette domain-containing protein [Acidaminococcaceae bacterium]|jgi:ABC-type multidrug transport system ATPase subunit|nr:ATP-binding cassette domain-containing protein [Acidaminococcaceae bacterium]MCI2110694.1 ATP-binding cassette domain-containing protein [Acidaminococcaceae bacterium]